LTFFKETELGHLGILNPADEKDEHLDWLVNDFLKKNLID